MLNLSLGDFEVQLNELSTHFLLYEKQIDLIRELQQKQNRTVCEENYLLQVNKAQLIERQREYISNIIYLYGSFERFIESTIKEYIGCLTAMQIPFSQHDAKFRDYYITKWLALYGKLDRHKFAHLSFNDLINSFQKTVVQDDVGLVEDCFLPETGNYSHRKVLEAMANLGCKDIATQLGCYEPLKSFISQMNRPAPHTVFHEVDELTFWRNEVAHNGVPSNIISNPVIAQSIDAIRKYSCALTLYLSDKLYRRKWEILSSKHTLCKVTRPFPKQQVYEFLSKDINVDVGMKALALFNSNTYPKHVELKVGSIYVLKNSQIVNVNSLNEHTETLFSVKFDVYCQGMSRCIFYR